jgi:hypothetical protein
MRRWIAAAALLLATLAAHPAEAWDRHRPGYGHGWRPAPAWHHPFRPPPPRLRHWDRRHDHGWRDHRARPGAWHRHDDRRRDRHARPW